MKNTLAISLLLIVAAVILSGCGSSEDAQAQSGPVPAAPPAAASVELSQSQLEAIKIGPVVSYPFPVEDQAVGNVSFDEDPAVVQAESTLLAAAAAFGLADKELARVQGLGTDSGIPQKELEQDISNKVTAEAALRAARDAVRALGVTDAQIDPMLATGKIASTPGAGDGKRWVVAYVPETDSAPLRAGQPVRVRIAALGDKLFDGRLSRVYGVVDPNTHRMTVRCEVGDPGKELRPGMLADVTIQIQRPAASIAVPENGVVREGDGTMTVWVTTDRRHFTQRTVDTGLREDGQVQILKGLQAGELVVTDGAIFLDNMLQAPSGD
ncbi:MAG TPA: efflux RND transporter periplasmic adaptor subunit [Gammaproteobacteria bacterium]|nr:efflux RND transporter periplasmic adaptor subunit [Gammaproteobacteria bacterium]